MDCKYHNHRYRVESVSCIVKKVLYILLFVRVGLWIVVQPFQVTYRTSRYLLTRHEVLKKPLYLYSDPKQKASKARFGERTLRPIHKNGLTDTATQRDEAMTTTVEQETKSNQAQWCPKLNIYLNGVVPSNSNDAEEHISAILGSLSTDSPKPLRIFGYGSLCWNPGGSDDTLSKTHEGVQTHRGRALGWRRCWAQTSADHRGTPEFLGLVCTLLRDAEVADMVAASRRNRTVTDQRPNDSVDGATTDTDPSVVPSMTEGLIYTIPPDLVQDCLAELDFREKGGYSRDVIDVMEDESGTIVKALLYRGTPDNPAFSNRALLDPTFAAATMAVAVGPSGKNDEYLLRLDTFLNDAAAVQQTTNINRPSNQQQQQQQQQQQHDGDTLTPRLASMVRDYQQNYHLYFLFGSGSNQHDQLLLESPARFHNNAPNLVNKDEAHTLKGIVLTVPKTAEDKKGQQNDFRHPPKPRCIYAGGGHSALLTENGHLYLWGWNGAGQLGRSTVPTVDPPSERTVGGAFDSGEVGPVIVEPLADIKVEMAALGHTHTLVIEKGTRFLYAFGDNRRGQAGGKLSADETAGVEHAPAAACVTKATIPSFLSGLRFVQVDAGLFHSAAITEDGELITFGEDKYGQCLTKDDVTDRKTDGSVPKWRPNDGSRLIKVCCGRRHTIVLDEHGRLWSLGRDNKYGQLGRRQNNGVKDKVSQPMLVDGILGQKGSRCVDIDCGWSHNIAIVETNDEEHNIGIKVYGWGRNDKAQLGTTLDGNPTIDTPQLLHTQIGGKPISNVCCGGESIMASNVDGEIHGCGWNEHGNLSTGSADDVCEFTEIVGVHKICSPPPHDTDLNKKNIIMATGGAHFLAMQSNS